MSLLTLTTPIVPPHPFTSYLITHSRMYCTHPLYPPIFPRGLLLNHPPPSSHFLTDPVPPSFISVVWSHSFMPCVTAAACKPVLHMRLSGKKNARAVLERPEGGLEAGNITTAGRQAASSESPRMQMLPAARLQLLLVWIVWGCHQATQEPHICSLQTDDCSWYTRAPPAPCSREAPGSVPALHPSEATQPPLGASSAHSGHSTTSSSRKMARMA